MELRIEQKQLPEPMKFNYEELKAQIEQMAHDYEVSVYTEEMIKSAKADRSKLNALKRSLNEERLRREREWMAGFQDFKDKINEIIAIIDKPAQIIDTQVKAFEEKQKSEKKDSIEEYFNNEVTHPEWLRFEQIFDAKWLNTTTSMTKVKEQIQDQMRKICEECLVIDTLPEYSFEAKEVYKETLDLSRAMAEGKRLADIQKRKEAEMEAKKILDDKLKGGHQATEAEIKAFEEKVENDKAEEEKAQNQALKTYKVAFEAELTVPQAKSLKAWFESEGITYKAVKM